MGPAVRDVWKCDVDDVFHEISNILDDYNYVAIDTEFPGIVLSPKSTSSMSASTINFLQLRENVNSLKIIQLGLSFSDANGKKPPRVHTYQFNFEFNLWNELHAPNAIEMLKNAGINFEMHAGGHGISVEDFAERLMSSGLVLNEDVHWISFHGMYDFGYPLQLLTNKQLPDTPQAFFESLTLFFPVLTDLKYLLRSAFRGGLQALATSVGAERHGAQHQGGSDALLTMDTFFKLPKAVQKKAFDGCLFGLNSEDKFWYDNPVISWSSGGSNNGTVSEYQESNERYNYMTDYAARYHHDETPPKGNYAKINGVQNIHLATHGLLNIQLQQNGLQNNNGQNNLHHAASNPQQQHVPNASHVQHHNNTHMMQAHMTAAAQQNMTHHNLAQTAMHHDGLRELHNGTAVQNISSSNANAMREEYKICTGVQTDPAIVHIGRSNWNRCGQAQAYIGTRNAIFGQPNVAYFNQNMGPPVDPPLA
eukprot:GEMP01003430.1.p1 GENE.GEMP01003430.1~~GEMP01003430.1.p1  ORF type:complete len:478 (-),score=89.98 GEMP01003430.1:3031-4464(-)